MQLSETEWRVMNVVWARHPASVRDVLEALEPETGWAYSTVKTILTRLAEKGVVTARKRANTSFYEPRITQRAARRSAVRSLLDRAFNGTFGSLVHHVLDDEKLSARDRAELREVIDRADRSRTRRR
jgi:BlaI family penicillinase repressor